MKVTQHTTMLRGPFYLLKKDHTASNSLGPTDQRTDLESPLDHDWPRQDRKLQLSLVATAVMI